MLTGKDVYEACYARQQRDGFGTLGWNDLPSETHAFWQEIAQSLNDVHIAPLRGLVRDLYRTVDELNAWDKLTDGWAESLEKRIKQLCGEEPKS